MTEVELTKTEQEMVKDIAQKRYEENRNQNVKDRKIGDQSNKFVDQQGMAGEVAAAKCLNLYPDLKIQVKKGGVDLELPDGTTIDVKTTEYEDGHLLAPVYKKNREHADVFVLVTGEMPEFKIRGWARAEELLKEENKKYLSRTESYALEQDELRPIDELR